MTVQLAAFSTSAETPDPRPRPAGSSQSEPVSGSDDVLDAADPTVTGVCEESGLSVKRRRDNRCLDDPNSGCADVLDAAGASAALVVTVDPAGPSRDAAIVGLNLIHGDEQLNLSEAIPSGEAEARTLFQTLAAQALGRSGTAERVRLARAETVSGTSNVKPSADECHGRYIRL